MPSVNDCQKYNPFSNGPLNPEPAAETAPGATRRVDLVGALNAGAAAKQKITREDVIYVLNNPHSSRAYDLLDRANQCLTGKEKNAQIKWIARFRKKLQQKRDFHGFKGDIRHYYHDDLPKGEIFRGIHEAGNSSRQSIHRLGKEGYNTLSNGLHGYKQFPGDVRHIRLVFTDAHSDLHQGLKPGFQIAYENVSAAGQIKSDAISIHRRFREADNSLSQELKAGWQWFCSNMKSVIKIPHDCHVINQGISNIRAQLTENLASGWNAVVTRYNDVTAIPDNARNINGRFGETWFKFRHVLMSGWTRVGRGVCGMQKIVTDATCIHQTFQKTRATLNHSLAAGWHVAAQQDAFKAIPAQARNINGHFGHVWSELGGVVRQGLLLAREGITATRHIPDDAAAIHDSFADPRAGLFQGIRAGFAETVHHMRAFTKLPQDFSDVNTSFGQYWKSLCERCLIPGWQGVARQLYSHKDIPANAKNINRAFAVNAWTPLGLFLQDKWKKVYRGVTAVGRLPQDTARIHKKFSDYRSTLSTQAGIAEKRSRERTEIRNRANANIDVINSVIEGSNGGEPGLKLERALESSSMYLRLFGSVVSQGFETAAKMAWKYAGSGVGQGFMHAINFLARTAQSVGSLAIGVTSMTIASVAAVTGLGLIHVLTHIAGIIKPSVATVLTAAAMTVASIGSVAGLGIAHGVALVATGLARTMQSATALVAVPLVAAGSALAVTGLFLVQGVVHAAGVIGRLAQTAAAVVGTPVMLITALVAATGVALAQGIAHAASVLKPLLTALVAGTGMAVASAFSHAGLALAQIFTLVADITGRTLQSAVSALVGVPLMSVASALSAAGIALAQGITHGASVLKRVGIMAVAGGGMAVAHAFSHAGLVLIHGLAFVAGVTGRALQSAVAFAIGVPLMSAVSVLSKTAIYLGQGLAHVGDVIVRGAQSALSLVSFPVLGLVQGISHGVLAIAEGLAHAGNALWLLAKTSGSALGHAVVFTAEVTAQGVVSVLEGVAHIVGAIGTGARILGQPIISAVKTVKTEYTRPGLASMASYQMNGGAKA